MFTVINHLPLSVPVDSVIETIQREFPPVFDTLPGFRSFKLVKTAPNDMTVLIEWETGADAANGGAVIGPGLFNTHIFPLLAAEQQRRVGEVVLNHSL